jgi:hypothetical protein
MRKAGIAAAVALPLITSVVAPTAAAARSCIPFKGICNPKANFCCADKPKCQKTKVAGVFRCGL